MSGNTLSTLRRNLAQRMNFWGGSPNNTPSTVSTLGANNTLIDTARSEPDDEWDSSWIVLNPGSTDQVNSPTIWRQVVPDAGWVAQSSTFTILGTWPAPYTGGVPVSTPYELYKTFRPENWLQAVNYSLSSSYPYRHRAIPEFLVPMTGKSRIIDYFHFAKSQITLVTPSSALTVTEVADNTGEFQPGVYTLAYTYFNDLGETPTGPTTTVTIANNNSRINIAQVGSIPSGALGIRYYCSMQPGDATLDMLSPDVAVVTGIPAGINLPIGSVGYEPGWNSNGVAYSVQYSSPNPYFGVYPPVFNSTNIDFVRLHEVHQLINSGSFPEIENVVTGDLYKPLGDGKIMLAYMPINQYALRFVCTTGVPLLAAETDSTQEPPELIYSGGEFFLWSLAAKTVTVLNVNYDKLGKDAWARYQMYLADYKMDIPRDDTHRPAIQVFYR